jgi:exodeoxyribonuclease VII large subunit
VSLADFAADLRAPTPSAAAELLVPDQRDLRTRLLNLQRRMTQLQAHALGQAMQRADRAALRLQAVRPQARLQLLKQRQEDAWRRLQSLMRERMDQRRAALRHAAAVLRGGHPQRRLARLRERLQVVRPRTQAAVVRTLQRDATRLRGLARSLETVSPLATVARGYSILSRSDGALLRSSAQVEVGDEVHARLAHGRLQLKVHEKS